MARLLAAVRVAATFAAFVVGVVSVQLPPMRPTE
jgi:hypothetical protein